MVCIESSSTEYEVTLVDVEFAYFRFGLNFWSSQTFGRRTRHGPVGGIFHGQTLKSLGRNSSNRTQDSIFGSIISLDKTQHLLPGEFGYRFFRT